MAKGLGDTTVADWFREGRDFYTEIAAKLYDKPESEITKEERQVGKNGLYLPILYGAGPKKIAESNGISLKEGRELVAQFHAGLPWVRMLSNPPPSGARGWDNYQPGLIDRVLKTRGYIKTPWGRRLHVPQFGEFKMLNSLIQGSSADLMKQAIVRTAGWIRDTNAGYAGSHWPLKSRLVLTVHDEIVLDGPEHEVGVLHDIVARLMIDDRIHEVVPLGVDHEVTLTNLAEMIGYEQWKESFGNSDSAASSRA